MNRFITLFVVALVIVLATGSMTLAGGWAWDRDAGAKMRGDYGTGQLSRSATSSSGYYYRAPARTAIATPVESQRSFSYQPQAAGQQPSQPKPQGQQLVVPPCHQR